MSLPGAVLWDLDGTLVDTEPYWQASIGALVAAHGGVWTHHDAAAVVGNPLLVTAAYVRGRGVDLPPAEIVERMVDGVVESVRRHVPWRPGAPELLRALAVAGVPCALVTMSYRRITDAVTALLPPGAFAAVVTGEQVRHGKPHPEPYLTAAARLGVPPAGCVAVEDSPTGAASAQAAGVPVVAVPNVVPVPPAPGRVVVPTLAGLTPEALAELAQRVAATPAPVAPDR